MIHFFLKRYILAVSARRIWLIVALMASLAYLVFAAGRPDRFTIYQDISISENAPVALATSPDSFIRMGEVISRPDDFFLNKFDLKRLDSQFDTGTTEDQANRRSRPRREAIKEEMSLAMPSENQIRITYHGRNQKTGEKLVGFYSIRLLAKAGEGIKRSKLQASRTQLSREPLKTGGVSGYVVKLIGNMKIKEHRALWRSDRFFPAVIIFIIFFIVILLWIGIIELTDSSFKSERQVARYLELPTLGSLPDLNNISRSMGLKPSG